MILHGLAHDSHLAGGKADRAWLRLGVLVGLLIGAGAGAALLRWQVWPGLAATASLLAAAGLLLRHSAKPCERSPGSAPKTGL